MLTSYRINQIKNIYSDYTVTMCDWFVLLIKCASHFYLNDLKMRCDDIQQTNVLFRVSMSNVNSKFIYFRRHLCHVAINRVNLFFMSVSATVYAANGYCYIIALK